MGQVLTEEHLAKDDEHKHDSSVVCEQRKSGISFPNHGEVVDK